MPLFSPLGPGASTTRPAADPDAYGVQTWYKNCSAPGAADGTVPTASWFNHMIANWLYAAGEADVAVTNDHTNDTFIWQIIVGAVESVLAALGITSEAATLVT